MVSLRDGEGLALSVVLQDFKHSKAGRRLVLQQDPVPQTCAVACVADYLVVRAPTPGPLFICERGSPITRELIAPWLKALVTLGGLDPADFNTHSLRVGKATDLALGGASDAVIRESGRWASNAFLKYLRFEFLPLRPQPSQP